MHWYLLVCAGSRLYLALCVLVPTGVCWYLLVCAGSCWCALVAAGVRWYLLVCAGTRWCVLVHAGVRWYLLVCAGSHLYLALYVLVPTGVCWYLLVCAGSCWCALVAAGVRWYLLACAGSRLYLPCVCWYLLVCVGTCWCALVCAGTCWYAPIPAGVRWYLLVCAGSRLYLALCVAVTRVRWTLPPTPGRAPSATWLPRCWMRPSTAATLTPTSRRTCTRLDSSSGRSLAAVTWTVTTGARLMYTSTHVALITFSVEIILVFCCFFWSIYR